MSKFIEKHRKGLIGTIVFHTALALFMLFTSLTTTPPTFPEPEGVVVNYGTDETGLGPDEPAPSEIQETAQSSSEAASSQATPTNEPTEDVIADNTPNPVLTQETEDAPAIAAERKKEQERKRAEELEKKRIADEQKRLADEADRKAEEQRKQAEAAKQAEALAAQKIRDRASKAFGQSNGSTSSSQGIAGGDGNQGKPDGQAGVNNYKGGGNGNGIDWSLNGREAIELPHPNKGIQASGKVIVEIIVDNNGQVIEATPGKKGSTTTDGRLYEAAQRAAMKARFNVSASAPPHQKGTITYIFELQ